MNLSAGGHDAAWMSASVPLRGSASTAPASPVAEQHHSASAQVEAATTAGQIEAVTTAGQREAAAADRVVTNNVGRRGNGRREMSVEVGHDGAREARDREDVLPQQGHVDHEHRILRMICRLGLTALFLHSVLFRIVLLATGHQLFLVSDVLSGSLLCVAGVFFMKEDKLLRYPYRLLKRCLLFRCCPSGALEGGLFFCLFCFLSGMGDVFELGQRPLPALARTYETRMLLLDWISADEEQRLKKRLDGSTTSTMIFAGRKEKDKSAPAEDVAEMKIHSSDPSSQRPVKVVAPSTSQMRMRKGEVESQDEQEDDVDAEEADTNQGGQVHDDVSEMNKQVVVRSPVSRNRASLEETNKALQVLASLLRNGRVDEDTAANEEKDVAAAPPAFGGRPRRTPALDPLSEDHGYNIKNFLNPRRRLFSADIVAPGMHDLNEAESGTIGHTPSREMSSSARSPSPSAAASSSTISPSTPASKQRLVQLLARMQPGERRVLLRLAERIELQAKLLVVVLAIEIFLKVVLCISSWKLTKAEAVGRRDLFTRNLSLGAGGAPQGSHFPRSSSGTQGSAQNGLPPVPRNAPSIRPFRPFEGTGFRLSDTEGDVADVESEVALVNVRGAEEDNKTRKDVLSDRVPTGVGEDSNIELTKAPLAVHDGAAVVVREQV
ncbi:unnamed protein product [Amoebophrya sp. A25]|nr:unnamed protein product [Amoebophrya sp. A25]|eukprot:GSA25T00010857001.1